MVECGTDPNGPRPRNFSPIFLPAITTDNQDDIDAENLQLAVSAFEFLDEEFEKAARDNNVVIEYPCTIEGVVDFRNNLVYISYS